MFSNKKFFKNIIIILIIYDYYDENDYIRNYSEFIKYINKVNNNQLGGENT